MSREELLKHLRLVQEWLEEQEILEYELQKRQRLLKVTVEEARIEFLNAAKERFLLEQETKPVSHKNKGDAYFIFHVLAFTVAAMLLIFGVHWLPVIASWGICAGVGHFLMKKPTPVPTLTLETFLEDVKAGSEYQKLEHTLLADYLNLEISFLKNKLETLRMKLSEKSVVAAENRLKLISIIQQVESGESQSIDEAIQNLEE